MAWGLNVPPKRSRPVGPASPKRKPRTQNPDATPGAQLLVLEKVPRTGAQTAAIQGTPGRSCERNAFVFFWAGIWRICWRSSWRWFLRRIEVAGLWTKHWLINQFRICSLTAIRIPRFFGRTRCLQCFSSFCFMQARSICVLFPACLLDAHVFSFLFFPVVQSFCLSPVDGLPLEGMQCFTPQERFGLPRIWASCFD